MRGTSSPSAIVLVGMMGAGKTSVGSELARRLGWVLLDSDRQVEALAKRTVPEIWRSDGEIVFRRMETVVLTAALSSATPTVVAAAGGVVLDEGNRRLLGRHDPVVWLRARVPTLVARVGSGAGRPLLDVDPAGSMARLDAERRPLYEQVADIAVDVDDLDVRQVVDAITTKLGRGRLGLGPAQ